jgi:chromosome partitioning protein
MRKICVINHKGGVGKTTTAISIAAGLSRENRRVLIVDLDPQGNVHTSLKFHPKKDMFDLLFNNAEIKECIVSMGKNLDIIPSRETLTKAETLIQSKENKEHLLKQKLKNLSGYDYVIVDCPPSLGILNQNAILYADEVFIPVSTEYLAFDALKKIREAIDDINEFYLHDCRVTKIIPTMFDKRNKLSKDILSEMNNTNYGIVSDPIRVCSKLKAAPKSGQSIYKFAASSRGAKDYARLVRHVIYDEKVAPEERAEKSEVVA